MTNMRTLLAAAALAVGTIAITSPGANAADNPGGLGQLIQLTHASKVLEALSPVTSLLKPVTSLLPL